MAIIYKIFRAAEYSAFASAGRTNGAQIDIEDGYIHFSAAGQVTETASKHFFNEEGLLLLGVESDSLGGDLKWEPSRGGALFPHLYRELRTEDVLFVLDLPLENGRHRFEDLGI